MDFAFRIGAREKSASAFFEFASLNQNISVLSNAHVRNQNRNHAGRQGETSHHVFQAERLADVRVNGERWFDVCGASDRVARNADGRIWRLRDAADGGGADGNLSLIHI